ncbi:MAG: hypothetical protein SGJ09_18145 [Phycisphaerae bacterium]|nr:hypothetical protein [Phycisphaerae bacterium]
MKVARKVESAASVLGVRATVMWPCLARAVLARQRPSAETNLILSIAVSGPEDRLRGTVRAYVTSAAVSATDQTDALAKVLLERTASASFRRFGGEFGAWHALDVTIDGGPFVEIMIKRWNASADEATPAYVRTDLPVLLGLDGGRYGCPTIELTAERR